MAPSGTFSKQYYAIADKVVEIKTVVVHSFIVSDSEDPDIYAAQPLWEWQQSDAGKWIMSHAVEVPVWNRTMEYTVYGHRYSIAAKLKAQDYTFWTLKWGNTVDANKKW